MNHLLTYTLIIEDDSSEQQAGHFKLASFHQYAIRMCVVVHETPTSDSAHPSQTPDASNEILPSLCSAWIYEFEETRFVAVTHYQNERVNALKKNYNPHAKGFKDGQTELETARLLQQQSTQREKRGKPQGFPSKVYSISSKELSAMVSSEFSINLETHLSKKSKGKMPVRAPQASNQKRSASNASGSSKRRRVGSRRFRRSYESSEDSESEEEEDWENETDAEQGDDQDDQDDFAKDEDDADEGGIVSSLESTSTTRLNVASTSAPKAGGFKTSLVQQHLPTSASSAPSHPKRSAPHSNYMLRPRNRAVSLSIPSRQVVSTSKQRSHSSHGLSQIPAQSTVVPDFEISTWRSALDRLKAAETSPIQHQTSKPQIPKVENETFKTNAITNTHRYRSHSIAFVPIMQGGAITSHTHPRDLQRLHYHQMLPVPQSHYYQDNGNSSKQTYYHNLNSVHTHTYQQPASYPTPRQTPVPPSPIPVPLRSRSLSSQHQVHTLSPIANPMMQIHHHGQVSGPKTITLPPIGAILNSPRAHARVVGVADVYNNHNHGDHQTLLAADAVGTMSSTHMNMMNVACLTNPNPSVSMSASSSSPLDFLASFCATILSEEK
jgi:hypothetical protein